MLLSEKLVRLFFSHFPVFHITFIAQDNEMEVVFGRQIRFGDELVPPFYYFLKGLSIGHIKDQETAIASLVENVEQSSELLLASRVPYRITILTVIDDQLVRKLVSTDSDSVLALELLIHMPVHNGRLAHPFHLTQIPR